MIKNPYIKVYTGRTRKWNVLYRYLIKGKIHFTHICACDKEVNAYEIQKLLNLKLEGCAT